MSHHCDACPLRDSGTPCPDPARYCPRVAHDLKLPEKARFWSAKAVQEAGLPTPPRDMAPPEPLPPPMTAALPARPGQVRVGLLCPALTQGGAEQWQVTLARTVDPGRVSWRGCAVLSGTSDPVMVGTLGRSMPIWTGFDVARARALAEDCDVLVHWCIGDLPSVLDGLSRTPAVLEVCHSPSQSEYAVAHYRKTAGTDRWAAVSEYALRALPEEALRRAVVIGNCVDVDRLAVTRDRAAMHGSWGVPPGSPVVGYYGRLSPEKRPQVMVEIARALPPAWHTVVVGSDYYEGRLQAMSAGLPNIHWIGADPRSGDVISAMDVMVVPSEFESFGLTIAESIWMGTPVVSTPVGIAGLFPGLTRTVAHDATGEDWAREVRASVFLGRPPGQREVIGSFRPTIEPATFGRAWTDLFVEMGGSRAGL